MQQKLVDQLVGILSNVLRAQSDISIKVAAAEKVFRQENQALFDAYVAEREHLSRAVDLGNIALMLQGLREKMLLE